MVGCCSAVAFILVFFFKPKPLSTEEQYQPILSNSQDKQIDNKEDNTKLTL